MIKCKNGPKIHWFQQLKYEHLLVFLDIRGGKCKYLWVLGCRSGKKSTFKTSAWALGKLFFSPQFSNIL